MTMQFGKNDAIDPEETRRTQARYERIAPIYDAMEVLSERRFRRWRPLAWERVCGPEVLEVGVGTGKNMPYYPQKVNVTAVDLTPGMLERARRRSEESNVDVDLRLGNVQDLPFPDNHFDEAVATFVFCSVPDSILGLRELARVVKPGGHVLRLEHMCAANQVLGTLMDIANLLVVRMSGANINRRTVENAQGSGLKLERVEDIDIGSIFKLIVARGSA